MTESRDQARAAFIAGTAIASDTITPLQPDASFRRYFRLHHATGTAILMDAPPEHEDLGAFLHLTRHLQNLTIRVPRIIATDEEQGFALIEDLGDQTFTRLLAAGASEEPLYQQALEVLLKIAAQPQAIEIALDHYDQGPMLAEARLFVDWYVPAHHGKLEQSCIDDYLDIWTTLVTTLPPLPPTLVLRDYHVDNLMSVGAQCAVLDYQDAVLGSPAYDLISLLEDARRDVPPDLQARLLARYLERRAELDPAAFAQHCTIWGLHRHLKVAGIFTRLAARDNKPGYLQHLPRVQRQITQRLQQPAATALRAWFQGADIRF